jgi:cytoskeletal protein RodZ
VTQDRDEFRRRAVRAALMVAGIAAAIGLVIGLLTAGVVYLSGAAPDDEPKQAVAAPKADREEEIPSPALSPTASPSQSPSQSPSPSPSATAEKSRESRDKPTRSRPRKPKQRTAAEIRLNAGSPSARRYERVALRGRYPRSNGKTLAVQRFEGGAWRAFPTSATVRGGRYSTYIASGRPGPNRFRVVDRATGRTSNVVVVRVG